jgi:hypothetical protein
MKRAREVGIRKVVGAERKQLIFQFIGEAVIVTADCAGYWRSPFDSGFTRLQ